MGTERARVRRVAEDRAAWFMTSAQAAWLFCYLRAVCVVLIGQERFDMST